ncbi:MAG: hypothetical protein RLZZ499_2113 [Cyanobacteriota bacterium]|jgi:hypothetical protein
MCQVSLSAKKILVDYTLRQHHLNVPYSDSENCVNLPSVFDQEFTELAESLDSALGEVLVSLESQTERIELLTKQLLALRNKEPFDAPLNKI